MAGALPPPPMDGVALGRCGEIAATVDDMGAQASAAWESSPSSPSYMMSLPLHSHLPSSHLPLSSHFSPTLLPLYLRSSLPSQAHVLGASIRVSNNSRLLPCRRQTWGGATFRKAAGRVEESSAILSRPFPGIQVWSTPEGRGLWLRFQPHHEGSLPSSSIPINSSFHIPSLPPSRSPCLLHFLLTFLLHRTTCLSASLKKNLDLFLPLRLLFHEVSPLPTTPPHFSSCRTATATTQSVTNTNLDQPPRTARPVYYHSRGVFNSTGPRIQPQERRPHLSTGILQRGDYPPLWQWAIQTSSEQDGVNLRLGSKMRHSARAQRQVGVCSGGGA